MTKAVIFDMDGLMFDTESTYSIVHADMSSRRGETFTKEAKRSIMGRRYDEQIFLLNEYWGKSEAIEDLLREQDEALVKLFKESVEKLAGFDELISFLHTNNIRRCIGTSSRKFLVDILLEKFNLENEFEFIVSGDEVQKGKPDPEIYQKCLSQLHLDGADCLVLEDSINGIRAGVDAGCRTCAIPSEYTQQEDFSVADLIVDSLSDDRIKDFILS